MLKLVQDTMWIRSLGSVLSTLAHLWLRAAVRRRRRRMTAKPRKVKNSESRKLPRNVKSRKVKKSQTVLKSKSVKNHEKSKSQNVPKSQKVPKSRKVQKSKAQKHATPRHACNAKVALAVANLLPDAFKHAAGRRTASTETAPVRGASGSHVKVRSNSARVSGGRVGARTLSRGELRNTSQLAPLHVITRTRALHNTPHRGMRVTPVAL